MTAAGQKPCSQPAVASIAIAPTVPATVTTCISPHCARGPAPGPIAWQPGRKTDRRATIPASKTFTGARPELRLRGS